MKIRDPLNPAQVRVLRWISEACPDGVMEGDGHKTSARALHHRKLVRVARKDGRWHAALTSEGEYYVEHGRHRPQSADNPTPLRTKRLVLAKTSTVPSRGDLPPVVRAAKPPTAYRGKTEELIEQLLAAGGRLHIDRDDGRNIPGLVTYANRRSKVPAGMRIVQHWAAGGYDVRLEQLPDWVTAELTPIPVPDAVRRPHPVIETLRAKDSSLYIKGPARSRGLRLLHALVQEAVGRGYTVKDNMPKNRHGFHERGNKKGQLTITAHGHEVGVHLRQLEDRTPHVPTAHELRQQETESWFRMPKWDKTPSDRLVLRLDALHQTRQGSWSDGATTSLEDVLAEVLQEIELRCAAAVEADAERERQQALKRVRWEQAMRFAEADYVQHAYTTLLRQQAKDWREAQEVAAYAEAMRARIATLPAAEARKAEEWLRFAEGHIARLNPLNAPLALPTVPEPRGTDLQPFLQGWSHWGPG